MLAFSAARTYHRLATNIEDVGFEIRDQIMWIYSSGFPKAQDLGRQMVKRNNTNAKQWEGWKSSLKPAHEPIVLARKPVNGSILDNVLKHGVGALNIDATRLGDFVATAPSTGTNVIHRLLEEQDEANATDGVPAAIGRYTCNVIGEIPEYQKYFYCPKVSRAERHSGFEIPPALSGHIKGCYAEDGTRIAVGMDAAEGYRGNNHPTVKPVELMKYLVRLVTPKGGTVLDPFNGSGSTGMAALAEGCNYVGCDLDQNYVDISNKRISAYRDNRFTVKSKKAKTSFNSLFGE